MAIQRLDAEALAQLARDPKMVVGSWEAVQPSTVSEALEMLSGDRTAVVPRASRKMAG